MNYFKEIFIILTAVSIFFSLSLCEILIASGLIYTFYRALRKPNIRGVLSKPVLAFSTVTVLSTFLFNRVFFVKSIEEGFFQLIYLFPTDNTDTEWIKSILIKLFIVTGILLLPFAFFNIGEHGSELLWGGSFETGHFFSIFSLLAFTMFVYYLNNDKNHKAVLYISLFVIFSLVIILSFRRTAFLEFIVGLIILLFVFYKNRLIKKGILLLFSGYIFVFSALDYAFMSFKDTRFKTLNKMVFERSKDNFQQLNLITSSRYAILLDALEIIKEDFREKRVVHILIGHGIRPGNYLPHIYDKNWKKFNRIRYESFFIVSEFIERGLIGVAAILYIYFLVFRYIFSLRFNNLESMTGVVFILPLMLHLIGVIFTFFWDALLPVYLLLFKVGERYFEQRNSL